MNKYNTFFAEIKSFAVNFNISLKEDFNGIDEKEITDLENKVNFKFNEEMRSYLKHFGHKSGFKNFEMIRFTAKNILLAEKEAEKYKVREKIFKGKLVDRWDDTEYQNNLNEICFLNFFETNFYFTFIDSSSENFTLYHWDGGDESYKNQLTISSNSRSEIYSGLKHICDLRRWVTEKKSS